MRGKSYDLHIHGMFTIVRETSREMDVEAAARITLFAVEKEMIDHSLIVI